MLLAALLGTGLVGAQPVVPSSPAQAIEEGLRRQEERARVQQQEIEPHADVLHREPRAVVPTELPQETPCFVIRDVTFVGEDVVPFPWLSGMVAPYVGQCAGVEGLRRIVSAIDARLIERGYATTRASLPAQNLASGQLRVQLHVGRIAEVAMVRSDGTPDTAWGTWRNAFPMRPGDVLDVRDLEQGIEQMKRLPTQSVTTRLEPGAEPDTSRVVIERHSAGARERLRGSVSIDNAGNRATGRSQLASYLAYDNPLGLNDILLLSGNTNLEHPGSDHRSQSGSINYTIPWGYNLLGATASTSRFAQVVQGTTARFLSSGSSRTAELRWQRTVWRTASLKVGAYAAASTRRSESFLDDVEVLVQRRRTTYADLGLSYRQLLGSGVVDLDLGYRKGMSVLGAQEDLPTAATGGPTLRPGIVAFGASFSQPLRIAGRALQYSGLLRGQQTRDATLSIDQFAIGTRYSVRGFDGSAVLLAESGYFIRNELSTPVAAVDRLDASAYVGVDAGRVWGPGTRMLVGDKLAGMALGMRARQRGLQIDFSLGTPLYKPEGFTSRRVNPYVALAYAF